MKYNFFNIIFKSINIFKDIDLEVIFLKRQVLRALQISTLYTGGTYTGISAM